MINLIFKNIHAVPVKYCVQLNKKYKKEREKEIRLFLKNYASYCS